MGKFRSLLSVSQSVTSQHCFRLLIPTVHCGTGLERDSISNSNPFFQFTSHKLVDRLTDSVEDPQGHFCGCCIPSVSCQSVNGILQITRFLCTMNRERSKDNKYIILRRGKRSTIISSRKGKRDLQHRQN